MTLNKTRPLIYEHKFQSLIGNYNSPYISNSNSPLFPWFHNHTHILIIQESEIRIVKKRILRERGESEIFMEIGKTESFVLLPLFSVCVGIWCGIWKNEGSALSISRSRSGVLSGFRGRTDKRWCACAQYCRNGVVPILVSLPVGNFCFYREIQGFQSKWIVFSITNKITVLPRFPQPRFKGGFFFPPVNGY